MVDINAAHLAYVRAILRDTGLSPSGLAKLARVASTTLTRALNDPDHKFALSTTTIAKIAEATGRSPAPFLRPEDIERRPHPQELPGDTDQKPARIQVIGEVRAGVWKEKFAKKNEEFEPLTLSYIPLDGEEVFALLVADDSVSRLATAGDYLLCRKFAEDRPHGLRDGDYVAVERYTMNEWRSEITVRRLRVVLGAWKLAFDTNSREPNHVIEMGRLPDEMAARIFGRVESVLRVLPSRLNYAEMHDDVLTSGV